MPQTKSTTKGVKLPFVSFDDFKALSGVPTDRERELTASLERCLGIIKRMRSNIDEKDKYENLLLSAEWCQKEVEDLLGIIH